MVILKYDCFIINTSIIGVISDPENISKYEVKYVEQILLKCTKITMDKILAFFGGAKKNKMPIFKGLDCVSLKRKSVQKIINYI